MYLYLHHVKYMLFRGTEIATVPKRENDIIKQFCIFESVFFQKNWHAKGSGFVSNQRAKGEGSELGIVKSISKRSKCPI